MLQTPVTEPVKAGGTDSFMNAKLIIIALEANPIRTKTIMTNHKGIGLKKRTGIQPIRAMQRAQK
jgi:hypothetical protein